MKVALIGDIILDHYIIGSTYRISPEAPVPIVKSNEQKYTLGGVANLANNLVGLANDVVIYGAIGRDQDGDIIAQLCNEKKITSHLFTADNICTTTKTRVISRNQQMLRIDKEEFFTHNESSLSAINSINEYDFVAVSDYNKGYCSQALFDKVFEHKKSSCKVLIDPKGLDWAKYNGAFLVKPNLGELADIYGKPIPNKDEEVGRCGLEVFEQYSFQHLVITRGNKGMTLINKEGVSHFPAKEVDVYDVSGAGDTALAVIVHVLMKDQSLVEAIKMANLASSFVVTKPMTYAISTAEFDLLTS